MAEKVDIFMPLYLADYLADTTDLTAEEHGAYLLLLMALWRQDGRLENHPQRLARAARVPVERWPVVWEAVERFFDVADGWVATRRHGWANQHRRGFSGESYVYGSQWRVARRAALERDGFACRSCGDTGPLDVHHVKPLRAFQGDLSTAHRLENLLSLCRPCHADADVEIRRQESS